MGVYHLHIAKTGGEYLKHKLLHALMHVNIFYEPYPHLGWFPVEINDFVICNLREPTKRIVSHFVHATENSIDRYELNRKGLFEFYNNHLFLNNYQSKNILFDKDTLNENLAFTLTDSRAFDDLIIDKNVLYERIARIDALLKDTQLNDEVFNQVQEKMLIHLKLPKFYKIEDVPPNYNDRSDSSRIYAELSQSDLDFFRKNNELDYEIYENNSLFWNGGK
jgi:hypothetical protein